MSDQQIIESLIMRDAATTRWFFYEKCRPLFLAIIKNVFSYPVDYDEFVNELYALIMEDDCRRLRQFDFRSSPYQWIKTVAIRHFIRKRNSVIDNSSKEPLYPVGQDAPDESPGRYEARIDIDLLLGRMKNQRQAYVLRRLVLEEAEPQTVADEIGVTVPNLYNIKKRAMAALASIALSDKNIYTHGRNI